MTAEPHHGFEGLLASSAKERQHGKTFFRLFREQGKQHWKTYLASSILMGLLAACVAATTYLIGSVVNATTEARDLRSVFFLCSAIIGVFLVKGIVQYVQAMLLIRVHTQLTASYQSVLFDRLLLESMDQLSSSHSSETMSRLRLTAEAPAKVMDLALRVGVRDGLSVLALVAMMIYYDSILSLGCLLSVPIIVAFTRRSRMRLDDLTLSLVRAQGRAWQILQETLLGMRLIKAFNLEDVIRERAHGKIENIRATDEKISQVTWRLIPWVETLNGSLIALIVLYGSYRIIVLGATQGELVSFLTAFLLAYEPIKRLASFPVDIANPLASTRLLYETLDSKPSEPSDDIKPELIVSEGRIVLDNVSFAYREGVPVLRDLCLIAEPGQITALVGHSGGGKSTIFNLLLRLYEKSSGAIIIDGQNIADVSRTSVRSNIAYLGQDSFLFDGTIRENISVGRLDASQEQIVAAAQAARAHDFIATFPRGYDTSIGENGLSLSSGQRQRLAIARAFLKDAPIVLLDEPTTALDTLSEREVQRAIERLCKGRTVILIAHRIHTIASASAIYVIGSGKVLEFGNHSTLLTTGSIYKSLQTESSSQDNSQVFDFPREKPSIAERG